MDAREEILKRLRKQNREVPLPSPWRSRRQFEDLTARFSEALTSVKGEVRQVGDFKSALEEVAQILKDIKATRGVIDDDPFHVFIETLDYEEDKIPKKDFVLEDYGWVLVKNREEEEFKKYWPEFLKLEPIDWIASSKNPLLEHSDFGWRTYLSFILKRLDNKTDRIDQLDKFLDEYWDEIHK